MIPLTDAEYASLIYRAVWEIEDAEDEINLDEVFDALHALPPQEHLALKCRYREALSFEQVGRRLGGVGYAEARRLVVHALKELRRTLGRNMNAAPVIEYYEKILKEKDAVIAEKNDYIVELKNAVTEKDVSLAILNKQLEILLLNRQQYQFIEKNQAQNEIKIADMHFSSRLTAALRTANIIYCVDLIAYDSFDDILRINNIGVVALIEIAQIMSTAGYCEWVEQAMRNTQPSLREILQTGYRTSDNRKIGAVNKPGQNERG